MHHGFRSASVRLFSASLLTAVLAGSLTGCPRKKEEPTGDTSTPMTAAEARDALEESALADQAMRLTGTIVEITTDFTIGGAVADAVEEVRAFYASQLPCAEVEIDGSTLTVTYGVSAQCTYRGQTFTGAHAVTIAKNDENEVVVQHVWDRVSNGVVEVSGDAEVTWSLADPSRHVVHELEWTRLSDGRVGKGTGDRVQRPLAGGIAEGLSVEGERVWLGQQGTWTLDIEGVEMRWVDPIPQAGLYRLTTPASRVLELSFERVDGDTIHATLSNGEKSFGFDVTSSGSIGDAS